MPKDTYKSAAVPFVNQKGERSMKRVKVERYVAGKKPSYVKDEDEDDEYYTTDDEMEDEEVSDESDGDQREENDDDDEDDKDDIDRLKPVCSPPTLEDEDEDDPRFRKLKQLETKVNTSHLLTTQTASRSGILEDRNIVIDDEEDEEEIKLRHSLARARTLEVPIGPQAVLGDFADQARDSFAKDEYQPRKLETEDILKDLKLTGIKSKEEMIKEEEARLQKNLSDMLEHAKQEAAFKAQVLNKIEEDNKRELEKEALDKNDFSARDMGAVKTDDEDDELAFEEWKLREIKRVLRDRSERALS